MRVKKTLFAQSCLLAKFPSATTRTPHSPLMRASTAACSKERRKAEEATATPLLASTSSHAGEEIFEQKSGQDRIDETRPRRCHKASRGKQVQAHARVLQVCTERRRRSTSRSRSQTRTSRHHRCSSCGIRALAAKKESISREISRIAKHLGKKMKK